MSDFAKLEHEMSSLHTSARREDPRRDAAETRPWKPLQVTIAERSMKGGTPFEKLDAPLQSAVIDWNQTHPAEAVGEHVNFAEGDGLTVDVVTPNDVAFFKEKATEWCDRQLALVNSELQATLADDLLKNVEDAKDDRKKEAIKAVGEKIGDRLLDQTKRYLKNAAVRGGRGLANRRGNLGIEILDKAGPVVELAAVGLDVEKEDAENADAFRTTSMVDLAGRIQKWATIFFRSVKVRVRGFGPAEVMAGVDAGWFESDILQPGTLQMTVRSVIAEAYREQEGVTAREQVDSVQEILHHRPRIGE